MGSTPLPRRTDVGELRFDTTPGPWWAWIEGRDGQSGDTFIGQGGDPQQKDLYLSHGAGEGNVTDADVDFIAHARQDVPALLAEIRRLQAVTDA